MYGNKGLHKKSQLLSFFRFIFLFFLFFDGLIKIQSVATQYLQVYEHQVLRVAPKQLSQAQFDALAAFHERQAQPYFVLLHKGIRFRQYVGILQVGQLTIEILPKTDQYNDNTQRWQGVLMELLQRCHFSSLAAYTKAPLRLKSSPILWLYIELFAQQMELLLRKGLQRSYQTVEQNSHTWKGQIQFAKQVSKNRGQAQKIYSQQQVYNYQHPIHAALYQALEIALQVCQEPLLQQRLRALLTQFPAQAPKTIHQHHFEQWYQLSAFRSYHAALELAQLLVLQYSPDLQYGQHPVLAILFDMNQLFEQYIYLQLRQHLSEDWKVRAQVPKQFWANKTLRPDIWLQHQTKQPTGEVSTKHYILDTKWKILKRPSPSDEDLRQMYAYNHSFGATQSLLIYPNVFNLPPRAAAYAPPIYLDQQAVSHYCKVIFVDILNKKGTLNKAIAPYIIQQLNLEA